MHRPLRGRTLAGARIGGALSPFAC